MDARRVGLTTLVALGAVAVAGSLVAGFAGVHAHGAGGLVWGLGAVLPFLAIGAYAYLTHPDHPTTQRMAAVAALFALQSAFAPPVGITPPDVTIPSDVVSFGREQLWIAYLGFHLLGMGLAIAAAWLFGLYPHGRLETTTERRLLRPLWVVLVLPLLMLVGHGTLVPPSYEGGLGTEPNPLFIPGLAPLGAVVVPLLRGAESLLPLLGFGLLVARYRRSGTETRQRIKWLLVPIAFVVVMIIFDVLAGALAPSLLEGVASDVLFVPVVPAVALSLLLGLRQQRIVSIDVVLRRTLVYGLLWVLIAAVYIGIAAALGVAVSERFPVLVAILLTIGVTLAFQPARRWLESLADRWVFGARLSRYDALTRLGRLLEEAFALEDLLPHLARTVRMTLGLAWVRIELTREGSGGAAAVDGETGDGAPTLSVPVELGGERLGVFVCGPKLRGTLGDADRAVLEDLVRQAALAIRNVRLATQLAERVAQLRQRTDELAESRLRLVRAQEAERRRIERDLHDGIQQDLVALIGEVGRARSGLDGTASAAAPVLGELDGELRRVLTGLRELAHGIHPQVLTDRGLVEAVEAQARRCPLPVTVRVAGSLRDARFAPEIEGAAYFTVCEALANVLKHAAATHVEMRLDQREGELLVDVSDDGTGLPAAIDPGAERVPGDGHGLRNLVERLGALDGSVEFLSRPGGGTTLRAWLPTKVAEPARG